MGQKNLNAAITSKLWNQLLRLGFKCYTTQNLVWFTNKPFHKKSLKINSKTCGNLSEPYMTRLGYKTAIKLYEQLKEIEA